MHLFQYLSATSPKWRVTIAKNQNTYAKRQREMDKKFKAQEKRARREDRKNAPPEPVAPAPLSDGEDDSDANPPEDV